MSDYDQTFIIARDPASNVIATGDQEFCPLKGWKGPSSVEFRGEVRHLLQTRMRVAALLLFGGFVAFLLRGVLIGPIIAAPVNDLNIYYASLSVTAALGIMSVLLCTRCTHSLLSLRIFEALVFGLPAAFFLWVQHCTLCYLPTPTSFGFEARSTVPWLMLIYNYGFFIPNSWKRAATVIGIMALAPLVGAYFASCEHAGVHESLSQGGYSMIALWTGLSAVTAVYGAHRFGSLRREAFDAKRLGLYTLRKKLGSGGMGEVYLAEHHLLKRPCAIKLIRPEKAGDPQAIARFEVEVQSAAKLTHPNTIEIYDYGHSQDGVFYYAMEFLPGLSLQEIVDRYGPLPAERVVYLLRQVCSALAEAHRRGMIHRDIKPGNIFAAERGGLYDVAKLLDFGLVKSSKIDDESMKLTMLGTVVGSPLYASPETVLSDQQPDARSDIYSLGATTYFLLTGRPLFDGSNPLRVLYAHANETPKSITDIVPDVPEQLVSVVMKCLAKNPADRYGSVTELANDLSTVPLREEWTQTRAVAWWETTVDSLSDVREDREMDDTAGESDTRIVAVDAAADVRG